MRYSLTARPRTLRRQTNVGVLPSLVLLLKKKLFYKSLYVSYYFALGYIDSESKFLTVVIGIEQSTERVEK